MKETINLNKAIETSHGHAGKENFFEAMGCDKDKMELLMDAFRNILRDEVRQEKEYADRVGIYTRVLEAVKNAPKELNEMERLMAMFVFHEHYEHLLELAMLKIMLERGSGKNGENITDVEPIKE